MSSYLYNRPPAIDDWNNVRLEYWLTRVFFIFLLNFFKQVAQIRLNFITLNYLLIGFSLSVHDKIER